MITEKVELGGKQAEGYVIPLGVINLVAVVTDVGMLGCGAFDVLALDNFSYPAAKAGSAKGGPIATVSDLLSGIIKEANAAATERGIRVGMTGKEALELM